jgi:hypothetical protein
MIKKTFAYIPLLACLCVFNATAAPIALGKSIADNDLQVLCTKLWIGGGKDVNQITGHRWAFCAVKVKDVCIHVYRKGDSKAKANSLASCNQISSAQVTDQQAMELAGFLGQYGIDTGGDPQALRDGGMEVTEYSGL